MLAADSPFLRACRCLPAAHTPVWFMRQAGRSLPEYRRLRGDGDILDAIAKPDLAAELTLQPVRRYGVDAAILFSDIVVPLVAIGIEVEVVPGRGPVIGQPIRAPEDLKRLRPLEPEADLAHVLETVRTVVDQCQVPLIGFAGAPFTLASYLVEGGPSKHFTRTKALMHAEPAIWHELADRLAGIALASLQAQVAAGASAIQLFDSWAGALSAADYATFAMPGARKVLEGAAELGVPRIHFGVGTGELLGLMSEAGADVVGVDWRVTLCEARRRIGSDKAVQGNLDPAVCLAPVGIVVEETAKVLRDGAGLGHIFNLGHGVLPETDPEVLAQVVETVHSWQPSGPSAGEASA
ncbi:MAG: uroporphyrinogen decarboxylase [Acidimicrobiales bacterium]